jgi:hypothetical protein
LTRQGDPARTFAAACRHLFRHLHEPKELRKNPLVSSRFSDDLHGAAAIRSDAAIAAGIREAVRRCADSCLRRRLEGDQTAARCYTIIVDGDIGKISRTVLAKKLGLSERHYTRLQHDTRRKVAILFSAEVHAQISPSALIVEQANRLREISLLAGKGLPNEALVKADAIIEGGGSDCFIASVLALQGLLRYRYKGDVASAFGRLSSSQRIANRLADPAERLILQAEISLAKTEIDMGEGDVDQATTTAIATITTLGQVASSRNAEWLRLRGLVFASYGYLIMGRLCEAEFFLSQFEEGRRALRYAPVSEHMELAMLGATSLAEVGRYSEASRILAEAWIAARYNSLAIDITRLDALQSVFDLECGGIESATERLGEVCDALTESDRPDLRAQAYSYLARAQMRAHHPKAPSILANAQRALVLSHPGSSEWIAAKVAEAFSRVLLGDLEGAERAARAADDLAASGLNRRSRGSTLRELARVAHVRGHNRDAKHIIAAAIDAGYAVGKLQQTAMSLDLASQIYQRADYSREASALRNSLAFSGTA